MTQPKVTSDQVSPGTGVGSLVARDSNGLIPIEESKTSTGVLTGGQISFGTLAGSPPTTTKITISAGAGIIVDNHTDPQNPSYKLVVWPEFTDVEVTNIATHPRTFVAIGMSGSPAGVPYVVQQTTDFDETGHRDYIIIGTVGHANNTNVVAVRSDPMAAFDYGARLADLARAIGPFNITGNVYGPNDSNLNLDKTAGKSYRIGNNFHTSKSSPDITTDGVDTALEFNYSYQDGVGGFTLTDKFTAIDSDNYDDGSGTLASMPTNQWQVQIIKHFPGGAGHRIEYGQTVYGTKGAAIDDIPDVDHNHNPAFREGIIRSYLVIMEGATNLSDTAQAEFIEAGKFGAGGGVGSGGSSVFTADFESTELGIAANTQYSAAHGLGSQPKGSQAFLRCKTSEHGYSVGDEVMFSNFGTNAGSPSLGMTYSGLYTDSTNIYWYTGDKLVVTDKTTGAPVYVTLANWKIVLRAYA